MKTAEPTSNPTAEFLQQLRARTEGRYVAYAGIGSRETPLEVQAVMTALATRLEQWGLVLRSGGAQGADTAFARGTAQPAAREIYVPWRGFAPNYDAEAVVVTELPNYAAIQQLAAEHHPNWPACRAGARKLHSRNVLQLTGKAMVTHSAAVVCWTRDGRATGGTGQALRIAATLNIPVFNLQHPATLAQVRALLEAPL